VIGGATPLSLLDNPLQDTVVGVPGSSPAERPRNVQNPCSVRSPPIVTVSPIIVLRNQFLTNLPEGVNRAGGLVPSAIRLYGTGTGAVLRTQSGLTLQKRRRFAPLRPEDELVKRFASSTAGAGEILIDVADDKGRSYVVIVGNGKFGPGSCRVESAHKMRVKPERTGL
jgi:hypothetical protein